MYAPKGDERANSGGAQRAGQQVQRSCKRDQGSHRQDQGKILNIFLQDGCISEHFVDLFAVFFFFSFQLAEGKQEELTQKGQNEKKELQLRIEEMEEKEQALQARIEALQADNDFTNERLTALQGTTRVYTHARAHIILSAGMSREPCKVSTDIVTATVQSCHSGKGLRVGQRQSTTSKKPYSLRSCDL